MSDANARNPDAALEPLALTAVSATTYRPDIDGLRAVAVLAVVAYHAGISSVSGGFVGVDIFFVISGYLISGLIFAALENRRFSFRTFYLRRVRRLLPAFFVVTTASVLAGLVISLPQELVDLGQSLVASSLFSTNMLFWRETGYFAGPAEIKPLLHTWSLAVEEQFYLIFPLFFVALAKVDWRMRVAVVTACFVVSLLLSQWMVTAWNSAAFYLLPSRAWELLLGTVIALMGTAYRPTPRAASVIGAIGLPLMILPIFLLDSGSSFPGFGAIPACVGTALLILAGSRAASNRALSTPPLVFVGKVSYSFYLWHWPIFAFLRYATIDEPSPSWRLAAAMVAFVLAVATWKYVEQPFRQKDLTPWFRPGLAVAASCLLFATIGAAFIHLHGIRGRFSPDVIALLEQSHRQQATACMATADHWISPADACVFPARSDFSPTIALWGDSHAFAMVDELGREAARSGTAVRFFGYSGCPPVIDVVRRGAGARGRCDEWNDKVLAEIVADDDLRTVVISARHSVYLKGFTQGYGPAEGAGGVRIALRDRTSGQIVDPTMAGYLARLDMTVSRLRAAGKRVVLQLPVPEVGYDVPVVLAMRARWGLDPATFVRPRRMYEERQSEIRDGIAAIARKHGALQVDPASFLCGTATCLVYAHGEVLYSDDDHLSDAGVRTLMDQLQSAVFAP